MEAYQEPDFQESGQAQRALAFIFYNGLGVKRDYEKALTWFKKAAEQGNIPAADLAGWMNESGLGTNRNYKEAIHWYKIGSSKGSSFAEQRLEAIEKKWKSIDK